MTNSAIPVPAWLRARFARGVQLVELGHGGVGLRPETVAEARRIARGGRVSREKLCLMRGWLRRHGVPRAEAKARRRPQSPAAVAWWLWGADPAIPYASRGWRDRVGGWIDAHVGASR